MNSAKGFALAGVMVSLAVGLGGRPGWATATSSGPQYTMAFKTRVLNIGDPVGSNPTPVRASSLRVSRVLEPSEPGTPENGNSYTKVDQVTVTTTAPEAGDHIAFNPLSPSSLVAVTSDFSLRGGFNTTKVAYSDGDGRAGSWREVFVPLDAQNRVLTSDGLAWEANSNPTVAIDRKGRAYVASLYMNKSDHKNGIYVAVGTAQGLHDFAMAPDQVYPVSRNIVDNSPVEEDKPWVAVDNTDSKFSGSLYVAWSRFEAPGSNSILFSKSIDSGKTWSHPKVLNWASQSGAVQAPQVSIGPGGSIFVAYEVFYNDKVRRQFLTRSLDGGETFESATSMTPFFTDLTFSSPFRKTSFPSIAVNPINGLVYLVYSDEPDGVDGARIEFVRSRKEGGFTRPVMLAEMQKGQQFLPSITVDSTGVLHVSWFDNRNAPDSTTLLDIYATRSVNDGAGFAVATQVTGRSIDTGSAAFIGDYSGIVATPGLAHPFWTSGGFNQGILEMATLR
jgi:hypothetical protein